MHDPADRSSPGTGHNAKAPVQWQTPHRAAAEAARGPVQEPDLDLVEQAFVEGFRNAADPTSFLRLAAVPFALALADGRTAHLLRVELKERCDVGAVSQTLGGGHVVRPLPAKLVGRRRQLRFVYQADDEAPLVLGFADVRTAEARAPA